MSDDRPEWLRSIDVRTMCYQCPTCGAPIDVVRSQHPESAVVDLEPCGHEVSMGDLT